MTWFYNQWGNAEQYIKEGKNAIKWTRLSCRKFAQFFLFFIYPLTRTSESSDALHKLAAMPVRPHRYPALARIDCPPVYQPVLGDLQNLPK